MLAVAHRERRSPIACDTAASPVAPSPALPQLPAIPPISRLARFASPSGRFDLLGITFTDEPTGTDASKGVMRARRHIPGVSVYKPTRRNKPHHRWYVSYVEGGKVHVQSVSTNYETTCRYAMQVSERIERVRLGLVSGREQSAINHAATPLLPPLGEVNVRGTTHLGDYLDLLRARGRSPRWVQMVGSRCSLVLRKAEFEVAGDILADAVELALGALGDEEGWSDQTCHHYCKNVKQFTRWLRKSGRALVDVLEDLVPPSVVDAVHARRALEETEIAALLRAAENGPVYKIGPNFVNGPDRALLYRLAVETGLRANELRSLIDSSFGLGPDPVVRVTAGAAKNRKAAELPLRHDTGAALAKFIEGRPAGEPLFWVPDKPVLMMDVDRAAAGIPRETLYGVLDFHSLRHTFCTRIGASGGSVKTCQELMRHGDVRLTMRYMHTTAHNQVAAVEGMQGLTTHPVRQIAVQATGTDGPLAPPLKPNRRGRRQREDGQDGKAGGLESLILYPLTSVYGTEGCRFDSCKVQSASDDPSAANAPAGVDSPTPSNDPPATGAAPSGTAPSEPPAPSEPAAVLPSLEQIYAWLGQHLGKGTRPAAPYIRQADIDRLQRELDEVKREGGSR